MEAYWLSLCWYSLRFTHIDENMHVICSIFNVCVAFVLMFVRANFKNTCFAAEARRRHAGCLHFYNTSRPAASVLWPWLRHSPGTHPGVGGTHPPATELFPPI